MKPIEIEDLKKGDNKKVLDSIAEGIDVRVSKRIVKYLRSLNLRCADFDFLKEKMSRLMDGYFIGSAATNIGEPIYRAVRWAEKPTQMAHLSYPPRDKVVLGRANGPKNPMFYGSAGCHSTIMELAPSQGDRLAISKWQTKTNLHLACVGYTASALKGKSGLNRYEGLPWVREYAANKLSARRGNVITNEYIAREFTKKVAESERWNYKISAAISELILNGPSFGVGAAPAIELAGILYPSTPNQANADNVALRCQAADSYLDLVWVQFVEISEKTFGPTYSIRGLDYSESISEAGEINWQGSFPSRLIAGTDHSARHGEGKVEIVDNKNIVVGCIPYS